MDPFLGPRIEAAEAGRWLKALFLSGATLLGSGGSPLGGQSPAPVASSDAGPPLFRSPGSTAVLAVATSRWLGVATEPFDLLGDFRFLPESSTGNTRGQLFQVLESDGGGGEAEAASLGPGGSFIAVPWTLGCGCAEEGWGDTIWVSPGDTVAFLLTPTRKEDPPRGPPVFDVLGWHQPYPAGEMIPYWRKERVLNPDWLTPREFFGLLEVLPGEAAFRLDPGGSYHGVRAWSAERPERRTAFPLSAILSAADAGLMRVQGGSPGPGGGAR